MIDEIHLNEVTLSDAEFLYELLQNRDEIVNISHKKMPNFTEHTNFISSKPYTKWHIVNFGKKKIGSVYLSKQNEIGIFLKNEFRNMGFGKIILDLIIKQNPRNRFLANVNPKNENSQLFFKKNGFKLIQYTYELAPKDNKDNEKQN